MELDREMSSDEECAPAADVLDEPIDEFDVESKAREPATKSRKKASPPPPAKAARPPKKQFTFSLFKARESPADALHDEEDEEEDTRDERDPTFAEQFAPFFRKAEYPTDTLEFMLTSAECISSNMRADLDDPQANHSPVCEIEQPAWAKKRPQNVSAMVPVIKLYGVTRNGSSVCMDVYGFYPCFRLKLSGGVTRQDTLDRMRSYIEREVLQSDPYKARQVVSAEIVSGYVAFPYTPHPEQFMEFRLAHSKHINTLAKHFDGSKEMEDAASGTVIITPYSADDVLTQFMVTKKIIGCGWIRVSDLLEPCNTRKAELEKCPCTLVMDCTSRSVQPIPLSAFDEVAPLRIMGVDIECLKEAGMPDPKKHSIIIIGVEVCTAVRGTMDDHTLKRIIFIWHPSSQIDKIDRADLQFNYSDEKTMLAAFGSFVRAYDPDIYLGHNIVGFDIPYIVVRANQLKIPILAHIGRRCKFQWVEPREITSCRKNGTQRKTLRTDTPGVIQLDTLPLMQGASKESSYKLGNLAAKWLGDTKADVGYQMIAPLWRRSSVTRGRLGDYCLKDVHLAMGLAKHPKLEFVLTVVNLARETRVIAERLLRSGNQEKVRTLVLHQAQDPHFDEENLPVFFPYEKPKQRGKEVKYKGAVVIEPERGKSDKAVAVGDFKSLYPSVMISNNMCYTTELLPAVNAAIAAARASASAQAARIPDDADIPVHHTAPDTGTKFVHSEVRKGLLPMILKHLLDSRDQAKAMMKRCSSDPARKKLYDSKQLQLKIVANSVYGVLTASGGWFVRMEIGESVTSWGRSMICQAKAVAEAPPFSARVIYGDTDSIMMVFPDCHTVAQAAEKNKLVCKAVSQLFPPPVELQPEKVYYPHCQFGKKKYVGLCHIPPDPPKVDSKGVEKNRLDNCPYIRKMMAKVFDLLMVDENLAGALEYIHDGVAKLMQGKVDYADLVITKSISKSAEDYKGKQIHLEVATRMKKRDPSYAVAPGERIPYVIVYNGASKKGQLCARAEDPLWAIQHNMDIDIEYYIENQITNPLARVLMWYIAPKDMLAEIKSFERTISAAVDYHASEAKLDELDKILKKRINAVMTHVGSMLFGQSALMDIKRIKPRCSGPIAMFMQREKRPAEEVDAELAPLRQKMTELKAECTKCRGYEDDKIACVQRDCPTLFRMASVNRDIEDLLADRN